MHRVTAKDRFPSLRPMQFVAAAILGAAVGTSVSRAEDKSASILEILKLKKEAAALEAVAAKPEGEAKPDAKPKEDAKPEDKKDGGGAAATETVKELEVPAGLDAKTKELLKKALTEIKLPAGPVKAAAIRLEAVQVTEPATTPPPVATPGAETPPASGEKPADGAAPTPVKPREPVPPMFWMRDGTRLAGFPDLTEIHVETAYGSLVVPIAEVTRVRLAAAENKEQTSRVAKLVEQLGSEEFDLREEAMEELRKIGSGAAALLRSATESADEEVKSRAEKLLAEVEEDAGDEGEEELHLVALKGEDDEIVTSQFTLVGKIQEKSFAVRTRYGKLDFKRENILSVVFQEPLTTKRTFDVPGATFAARNKWIDTTVEFKKGAKLTLEAKGSLALEFMGDTKCGPEGTTNAPSGLKDFPSGALVARIGDSGTPFLVGPKYAGAADADGTLRLGVALKSGNVTGSFEVTLETRQE